MAACCLQSASKTCMVQNRIAAVSQVAPSICRRATAALLLDNTQPTHRWLVQGDCVGTHVIGRSHGSNRTLIFKDSVCHLETADPTARAPESASPDRERLDGTDFLRIR